MRKFLTVFIALMTFCICVCAEMPEYFEILEVPKEEGNEVWLDLFIEIEPENGVYFVEGEQIRYLIELSNEGEIPITDVQIFDPLRSMNEFGLIACAETVEEDGGAVGATAVYTVTAEDVAAGRVLNIAYARIGAEKVVFSNVIAAKTGKGQAAHEGGLTLTLSRMNAPANGRYYRAGEEVKFLALITNDSEESFQHVELMDFLSDDFDFGFGVPAHDCTHSVEYTYTVTEEDERRGYITNRAELYHDYGYVISNGLYTLTADPAAKGYCSERYCEEHDITRRTVRALLDTVDETENQILVRQYACRLWGSKIDEIYEGLLLSADETGKGLIETERELFFRQMNTHEALLKAAYPGDPVYPLALTEQMYADRCAQLCAEAQGVQTGFIHVDDRYAEEREACIRKASTAKQDAAYTVELCREHAAMNAATAAIFENESYTENKKYMSTLLLEMELTGNYSVVGEFCGSATEADREAFQQWRSAQLSTMSYLYGDEYAAKVFMEETAERIYELCGL